MNAVEGFKKCVSTKNKHTMDDIDDITDDNEIIVFTMKTSPNECQVVFTKKNLLKIIGNEVIVAHCDSTYNCTWNMLPFRVLRAIDKHHHFHPVG